MERVVVLNDTLTGSLFAIVTEKARVLNFVGAGPEGNEWARWAERQTNNRGRLEDVIRLLDYGVTVDGPKGMTRRVRSQLSEYAPKVETEEAEEIVAGELVGKAASVDNVLISSSPEAWRAHLNAKALMWRNEQIFSAVAYEVKRLRAMRIPSIGGRGGGWRCPVGTPNGGNFTDRFGTNCGTGTTRRLLNRMQPETEGDRYTRRRVGRAAAAVSASRSSGGRSGGRMGRLSYGQTSSRSSGRRYDTVQRTVASRPRTGRPAVNMGSSPAPSRREKKPDKEPARKRSAVSLKSLGIESFRSVAPRDLKTLEKARSSRDLTYEEMSSFSSRHMGTYTTLKRLIDRFGDDEKVEANILMQHHLAMASRWDDLADLEASSVSKTGEPDVLERRAGREAARRRILRDHLKFIEDVELDVTAEEYRSIAAELKENSERSARKAKNKNLPPQDRVSEEYFVSHYAKLASRYEKLAKIAESPSSRSMSKRTALVKEVLENDLKFDVEMSYLTRDHFENLGIMYRLEAAGRRDWAENEDGISDDEKKFNEIVSSFYDDLSDKAEDVAAERPKAAAASATAFRQDEEARSVKPDNALVEKTKKTFNTAKKAFDKLMRSDAARRQRRINELMTKRYGDGQPPPWLEGLLSIDDIWGIVAGYAGDEDGDSFDFDARTDPAITAWAKSVWEHQELDTGKFKFRTKIDDDDGVTFYPADGEIYISGSIEAYDPDRKEWILVGTFMRRLSENNEDTVYSEELKMGSGLYYPLRGGDGKTLRDVDGNVLRAETGTSEGYDIAFGDKVRGAGFASLFNGHAFTLLRGSGFKYADVTAVDDGSFVWGKIGYREESVAKIQGLVETMENQLVRFENGKSSIISSDGQAELVEYLIELANAMNFSYDGPQWPEFILALSSVDDPSTSAARSKELGKWFQDFAPFGRGTLPFTDELVPLDPR